MHSSTGSLCSSRFRRSDFSLWPWPVQHIPLKWVKSGRSVATDEAVRDIPTSLCDQIISPVWKKISLGSLRYPMYANLGNVAMQALEGSCQLAQYIIRIYITWYGQRGRLAIITKNQGPGQARCRTLCEIPDGENGQDTKSPVCCSYNRRMRIGNLDRVHIVACCIVFPIMQTPVYTGEQRRRSGRPRRKSLRR